MSPRDLNRLVQTDLQSAFTQLLGTLEVVDAVGSSEQLLAALWDFWTPLMSLPRRFETTLDSIFDAVLTGDRQARRSRPPGVACRDRQPRSASLRQGGSDAVLEAAIGSRTVHGLCC